MNEQTLKLLERALAASPQDWETRLHLAELYVQAGQPEKSAQTLRNAPNEVGDEDLKLRKAEIEAKADPQAARETLQAILAHNKACAPAHLILSRVLARQGLAEEARRRYLVAAVLDESLDDSDAAIEAWLDGAAIAAPSKGDRRGSPQPKPMLPRAHAANADDVDDTEVSQEEMTAALQDALVDAGVDDDESPKVTFKDIGGMDEVIDRIRMNIIHPFRNPEIFKRFNKKPGGGILMYGPPGCGKTHIARATAGECGAAFITVSITDILSKWVGESERHLHDIFESARRRAPAVIFMDEIDAIGASRADAGRYLAPLVNVLLTEMDGISSHNENVMVLAATNTPWRIDNALRRPGRFDRVLFIPPPDAAARLAILKICLQGLPVEDLNLHKIVQTTERYSGADLRAIVERAAERAIREELRTGRATALNQRMLQEAAKETHASTSEWLETARSYATYANKTGLYDELARYFER